MYSISSHLRISVKDFVVCSTTFEIICSKSEVLVDKLTPSNRLMYVFYRFLSEKLSVLCSFLSILRTTTYSIDVPTTATVENH